MSKTNATKVRRPGAGRTKGSFSFVKVKVKDLANKFLTTMPDLEILVSRKQMESFGLNDLVTDRVGDLKESIAGQSIETAPKIHTTDF